MKITMQKNTASRATWQKKTKVKDSKRNCIM